MVRVSNRGRRLMRVLAMICAAFWTMGTAKATEPKLLRSSDKASATTGFDSSAELRRLQGAWTVMIHGTHQSNLVVEGNAYRVQTGKVTDSGTLTIAGIGLAKFTDGASSNY